MTGPTVVILDDDPTGTQVLADIPVVTVPTPGALAWAFDASPAGFFVLTNSRSLDEDEMTALIRATVEAVLAAAGSRPVRFVSRSDSTLRGHIVSEVEAVRAAVADVTGSTPATTVFVPAFPAAGRITRDGVHVLREGDSEVPAHESGYASDATFGYDTSFLPELVAQRSGGALTAADIPVLSARDGDELEVGLRRPGWVVCDAEDDEDLVAIARGMTHADSDGSRIVVRASPGILPALLGRPASGEVAREGEPATAGGLVIVGSHVARTTRQLQRLLDAEPAVTLLTLDVGLLADADDDSAFDAHRDTLVADAVQRLRTGHVAIATARTVRRWDDPRRSLAFARRVSEALVEVTRRIHERTTTSFVVAKGGITSSDIATRALGIDRAIVRGRVGAGIVWEPVGATLAHAPFAVVPGNIGGDDGLLEAVRGMSYQRSSAE